MLLQTNIEILSYWHAGTGLGLGALADAITLKDEKNIPYLPGKTIKGLFREAFNILEETNNIPPQTTHNLFGEATSPSDEEKDDKEEIIEAQPGKCFFSNANVSRELRKFLLENENEKECLYDVISSTKLDDKGMAEDKSLRTIEVCMPVTLSAIIDIKDGDTKTFEYFQKASGLIRNLGSHRHRGLGRCKITVKQKDTK